MKVLNIKKIKLISILLAYILFSIFILSRNPSIKVFLLRFELITIFFAIIAARVYFGKKVFYDFVFKNRLVLSIVLFVIMVISNFNYSSVGIWNEIVQPGSGSVFMKPIFGKARTIRSDEWLVRLPQHTSAKYVDFGKTNDICRATKTDSLSSSGLFRDFGAIAKPAELGYYFLDIERGESFFWNFRYIFGFLVVFELCYLITEKNKLLGVFGALLIIFSPFYMWWSTIAWIVSGCGALVCFYHLLNNKNNINKMLFGILTAIFLSNFIVDLYPAWQVPSGYVFLMLLIWMILNQKDNIKNLDKIGWGIIALSFIVFVIITSRYIYNLKDYIKAVIETEYPGHRISHGREGLNKIFHGLYGMGLSFYDSQNPSEFSNFCVFFPFGIILAIIALIKNKFKNSTLIYLLFIPTIFFIWYCELGLPHVIGKVTLMNMSLSKRVIDVLGFLNIFLIIKSADEIQKKGGLKKRYAIPISILVVLIDIMYSIKNNNNYRYVGFIIIVGVLALFFLNYLMIKNKNTILKIGAYAFVTVALISGICINPINYGLKAIISKPVYKKVREIVKRDPDAKWLGMDNGIFAGNYLITSGAKTYNSVNTVPNYEFWKKLGVRDRRIYNRYAHVMINFNDEAFKARVVSPDAILVNMRLKDIKKLGVKYVMENHPLEDNRFKELYKENGTFIYQVKY